MLIPIWVGELNTRRTFSLPVSDASLSGPLVSMASVGPLVRGEHCTLGLNTNVW